MNNQIPVSENEEVDVRIESVGEKGDGVARVQGYVVFVPETKAGELVKIKITKCLPKIGFGQVVERLDEKPTKKEPEEPEFDTSKDTEDFGDE